MATPEQSYTPEYVDEQIEFFLQSHSHLPDQAIPASDLHLLHDLRSTYQTPYPEDAQSLARIQGRLLTVLNQQEQLWQDTIPYPAIPTPLAQQSTGPVTMHSHQQHLHATKPRQLIFQRLSVLVAAIVIFVVVGSTIAVFNTLHRGSSSGIATTPTVTSLHTLTPIPATKVGQIINQFDGHFFSSNLSWSPDGTRIAGTTDDGLQSWDATTYKHIVIYKYPGTSSSGVRGNEVLWSPDGKSLAVIVNAAILIFDANTTHLRQLFSPPSLPSTINPMTADGGFYDITWSPDSRFLASTYAPNKMFVWNVHTGSLIQTLTNPDVMPRPALHWSPDGRSLALVTYNGKFPYDTTTGTLTLRIWDTTTWKQTRNYPDVTDFSWSPDGKQIALLDESHTPDPQHLVDGPAQDLRVIDAFTSRTIKAFAPEKNILAVRWSPDGTRIALEYQTGTQTSATITEITSTIKIWSVKDTALLYTFPPGNVSGIFWSPNSKYIVSSKGGINGEITPGQPFIWAAE